tara:strand:- start:1841 stop:2284 length:444 start_codon:yes stop_codon:yes gene_type:complete
MLSKITKLLVLSFIICPVANGQDGRFTLVPKGGQVPFEATCFDDVATAKLLTWKEFLAQELSHKCDFEKEKLTLDYDLELQNLRISLEETLARHRVEVDTRDKELEDLRKIIKKDRKVNMPVVIVASVVGGIALGFAGAYAIKQVVD